MGNDFKQKRAERVKTELSSSKQTQKVGAEKAHITPQHLTNVKNGKKPLTEDVAKSLAETLNIRFEYLMGYDDFRTQKDLEEHYLKRFSEQNNAFHVVLDYAVTEVCLNENIPVQTLDNIAEILYLESQIKDYAVSLVWQYLIHREHSSTWRLLDQREV